ncbi:MAG: hypothetical protein A2048_02525 [Deltaproteobacteria bacterium GWA2_45_12]|nr:MAG: hypothetical protein A2048_02525 [Deltaproteobacteria bacterium GWA2_45_12]
MKKISYLFLGLVLLNACGGGKQARLPPAKGQSQELNRCLKYSTQKKYKEAVDCLEVFKSRYPGQDGAAEADLLIGDTYFRQKDYLLAADTYQSFIKTYPSHSKIDYAYYRSGLSYLQDTPRSIDKDQEHLDLAVENLEVLPRYFPQSPYAKVSEAALAQAKSKQAHLHFYVGRFYYKYHEYLAAAPRFEEIVTNYPYLGYDEKSFYYLVSSYVKTKKLDKAREAVARFEERYPRSKFLAKAKSKIN